MLDNHAAQCTCNTVTVLSNIGPNKGYLPMCSIGELEKLKGGVCAYTCTVMTVILKMIGRKYKAYISKRAPRAAANSPRIRQACLDTADRLRHMTDFRFRHMSACSLLVYQTFGVLRGAGRDKEQLWGGRGAAGRWGFPAKEEDQRAACSGATTTILQRM